MNPLRRLARLLTRRPAPVWPDEDLPSVYLPDRGEPPAPDPDGEPDWCTWRDDPAVRRLLADAEQAGLRADTERT
ncbi:hypothetical protein [Kitasatospora sp. DSM 101779]|uniref:hypothetical protein n=1 Tax=Kitasatospora sp. DSM 101779 TaxID=2853165 RepID=UPI0021D8C979|nr:hypothetical protein [Kitasatospora sp. DSM 101779]MCU7827317.1 hypothetical protein [Kitasatospora sp. DSM 101779]